MANTILVNTLDVYELPGCEVVGEIEGIFAPGERRGDDDPIPGADGELLAELPLAAYIITIPLRIFGATGGLRNANIRNLSALLSGWDRNGLVDLERRIENPDGSFDPGTAPGRFITGLSPNVVNPTSGRTSLKYKQGAGFWLNGTTAAL